MVHSPAFLKLCDGAKARIREISPEEIRAWQGRHEPFHFIDVREDHEWAQGYAEGARHLGRGILERDIERQIPNKDDVVVLYCGGGFRSALSAASMQDMGYTHVLSMSGGIVQWQTAGFPMAGLHR